MPDMAEPTVAVLVVDDNPSFLRVVRAILSDGTPSFTVHTAQSGSEAVAFLERRPPFADVPRPAFVVLDFHLPDFDAPEVLRELEAREELRTIPVLVMTQASWEHDEAAALAAGASAFRVKPSRLGPLRDTVVSFWREHVHAGDDPFDRG